MAIIFCDTDCELSRSHVEKYDIKIIHMPYTIDGEEKFADLDPFDPAEFYNKMRNGASASTAGLNDSIYYDYFRPYFEKGEDILYIAFSSKMSNTFEYLEIAINRLKAEYPNVKYRRFDTLSICVGAGIQAYLGAKYCREHGDDIDATCTYLEDINKHVGLYFVVDNMKYLARGGRISPAKAKIGNLMNIKPVLVVKDGKLDVCSKQNGVKKAYKYMIDMFAERYNDMEDAPVIIVDADNAAAADNIESKILELYPKAEIWRQPVGPVIGAHAGPGVIGLIFMAK